MSIVLDGNTGVTAPALTGPIDAANLTGDVAAARITSALNATGSAPIYACRAWVNFNGTGTVAIRASGNVSSITDNGAGDYTVNFTTAVPDANYAVSGSLSNVTTNTADSRTPSIYSLTTSSVRMFTFADTALNYLAIFR